MNGFLKTGHKLSQSRPQYDRGTISPSVVLHPPDTVPHLKAVGEDLSGDDAALDVELGEEEERAGEEETETQADGGQKEGLQTNVRNNRGYKKFYIIL